MASNANLIISITAKDQASGTFRTVKARLGDLEKSSSDLGDGVGGLGDIFGSTLGKIGAGIGAAFAVEKIASAAFELGKVGAAAERTQASFGQMAASVGSSGDEMLAAMRQATAGTVSNSELMLAANRAIMLGVADNADEMARLMAAAIERGRALGVSASQAVSDIITGIGRMSPQILDNLGIVGATKFVEDYAKSLGKTADQLDDIERKQALVNAVLSQASGATVVDDAASSFERMDAAIQNAKEALGQLFAPAVAAIAEQIAAAASTAAEAAQRANAEWPEDLRGTNNAGLLGGNRAPVFGPVANQPIIDAQAELKRLHQLAIDAQDAMRDLTAQNEALAASGDYTAAFQIEQNNQQLQGMAATLGDVMARMRELGVATAQTEEQVATLGTAGWDAVASWQTFGEAMTSGAEEAQAAADQLAAATATIQNSAQSGLNAIARSIAEVQGGEAAIDWLRGANAQLERMIALWTEAGYTPAEITGVILPQYLDNLGKIVDKAQAAYTATANIGKGAVQADATAAGALRRFAARVDVITTRANIASAALVRMGRISDAVAASDNPVMGLGVAQSKKPTDELADSMDRLRSATQEFVDIGTGGGGGGGISAVGDQFDDLRSKVQGIIDQSTTLDVGLNPADFLPREDAINENARRLAAIMRDGIGNQEWLEEFKSEVPALWQELSTSGDPKTAAARMLQEFQAGLRPELLDKQMIKDRVKAMILGDQSSADLANEIAQELSAELGVSLAQAQQAVGATLGTGAMLPLAEQAGPDAAQPAENFVNKWAATVTGMVSTFDNTGRTAGTAFGAGFMAVQGTFIDQWAAALVSLVTAGVIANMAAQQSRTGAR